MLAGHAGTSRRPVRGGYEFFPGLPLRSVLAATYAWLSENRDEDSLLELDRKLGIEEDEYQQDDDDDDEDTIDLHDTKARMLLAARGTVTTV